ncbi:MAG: acyl-CoA dehydrogenase family protein, partial [Desulfatiglandales bacterium]
AARLLTYEAAWRKDQGLEYVKDASMAKLFASEMAQRAAYKALQIHGGYGYMKDFPVERYYRDVRVLTIYEGTSEIQRTVISREVLGT